MAGFQERAPRLNLSFPLEFHSDDGVIAGSCLNISESGLMAAFPQVLDLWSSGELHLHLGEDACTVPARVARIIDSDAGFTFLFRDQSQRDGVQAILALAAARTHLAGPPPF